MEKSTESRLPCEHYDSPSCFVAQVLASKDIQYPEAACRRFAANNRELRQQDNESCPLGEVFKIVSGEIATRISVTEGVR